MRLYCIVHNSVVPTPPPSFLFTIIHRSGRQVKNGKAWRLHHVCGCKVDVGREGLVSKYVRTKLESRFVNTTSFNHTKVCSRALKRMIQCIVLAVGPLPSSRPPVVIHMMIAPGPFPCCCPASGRELGQSQEVSLNMVFVELNRNKVGNFLHISALQEIVMMCLGPIHPS